MPACFQLIDKITNKPAKFNEVDDRMCETFGVKSHPKKWFHGWFDYIGFMLAIGKSFDEIRRDNAADIERYKNWDKPEEEKQKWIEEAEWSLKICNWLEEHYTPTSWREIGNNK